MESPSLPESLAGAVRDAEPRLRPYVLRTPLEPSPALSALVGGSVLLKLENTQRTGSFKLRGAVNKLLSLDDESRLRGVVTASSGNHGLAVAHAARELGISAEVYVAEGASASKTRRIQALGAGLRVFGEDGLEAELEARRVAELTDREYVSPYNDPDVVAGQGSVGLEIVQAREGQRPLDAVFVALGGGGLIAGIAAALKAVWPDVEVVACSPIHSPVMAESVRAGLIVEMPSLPTLSDGTAGGVEPGAITFSYCQALVDRYVDVTEHEIESAMRHLIEVEHTLVEGAAALPLAALRRDPSRYRNRTVALVLCGANVGAEALLQALSGGASPA